MKVMLSVSWHFQDIKKTHYQQRISYTGELAPFFEAGASELMNGAIPVDINFAIWLRS